MLDEVLFILVGGVGGGWDYMNAARAKVRLSSLSWVEALAPLIKGMLQTFPDSLGYGR